MTAFSVGCDKSGNLNKSQWNVPVGSTQQPVRGQNREQPQKKTLALARNKDNHNLVTLVLLERICFDNGKGMQIVRSSRSQHGGNECKTIVKL